MTWIALRRTMLVTDAATVGSMLGLLLAARPSAAAEDPGEPLYRQTCATCHMTDGTGVPGLQPAIDKSAILAGDPGRLIRLLLRGPAQSLAPNRVHYANKMPTFEALADAEIADVLNYARRAFAKRPAAITPAQVAAIRAKP